MYDNYVGVQKFIVDQEQRDKDRRAALLAAREAAERKAREDAVLEELEHRERIANIVQESAVLEIPYDCWYIIFEFGSPLTCARTAATCAWMHHICDDNLLWKKFWSPVTILASKKGKPQFSFPRFPPSVIKSAAFKTGYTNFPERPLFPWSYQWSFRLYVYDARMIAKRWNVLTYATKRDRMEILVWMDLYDRAQKEHIKDWARIQANRMAGMANIALGLFDTYDFTVVTDAEKAHFLIPNTTDGIATIRTDLTAKSLSSDVEKEVNVCEAGFQVKGSDYNKDWEWVDGKNMEAHSGIPRSYTYHRFGGRHRYYGQDVTKEDEEDGAAKKDVWYFPWHGGRVSYDVKDHANDGVVARKQIPQTSRGRKELKALMAQLRVSSDEAMEILYGSNAERRRRLQQALGRPSCSSATTDASADEQLGRYEYPPANWRDYR